MGLEGFVLWKVSLGDASQAYVSFSDVLGKAPAQDGSEPWSGDTAGQLLEWPLLGGSSEVYFCEPAAPLPLYEPTNN